MSILIRNIDKTVYAKFKAKAAEKGLKIGEALTIAMKEWIELSKKLTVQEKERDVNLVVFRTILRDLEKNHMHEWALISGGELICVKKSRDEIQSVMKSQNLIGKPCYTFQIGKKITKRTFGIGSRTS
ncbi:MAG: hypothetical protein ACTSX4_06140 [Candidatus Helarchaeota archaeon]